MTSSLRGEVIRGGMLRLAEEHLRGLNLDASTK